MTDATTPTQERPPYLWALFVFIGMLALSLPWHLAGLFGMPRRMAYFDYSSPALAPDAWTVTVSVVGGALLVASGLLFVYILAAAHFGGRIKEEAYRFSVALHEHESVPAALNGFAVWFSLMIALTLVNYGFPIWQLMHLKTTTAVPAVYVGGGQ